MNELQPVIRCQSLTREFVQGATRLRILDNIELTVQAGEQIAIIGSSGSGKTTLLHLLGGLDKPTSGEVIILDNNISQLPENKLCQLRNRHIGFIYQFHHLLPEFSALENVAMPLLLGNVARRTAQQQAGALLDAVGLQQRYQHKLAELSGGERQRVAIARALVTQPQCVLADEPTGNLDNHTAQQVYQLMQQLHRKTNTAFILVTHDHALAQQMDTVYKLEKGQLGFS